MTRLGHQVARAGDVLHRAGMVTTGGLGGGVVQLLAAGPDVGADLAPVRIGLEQLQIGFGRPHLHMPGLVRVQQVPQVAQRGDRLLDIVARGTAACGIRANGGHPGIHARGEGLDLVAGEIGLGMGVEQVGRQPARQRDTVGELVEAAHLSGEPAAIVDRPRAQRQRPVEIAVRIGAGLVECIVHRLELGHEEERRGPRPELLQRVGGRGDGRGEPRRIAVVHSLDLGRHPVELRLPCQRLLGRAAILEQFGQQVAGGGEILFPRQPEGGVALLLDPVDHRLDRVRALVGQRRDGLLRLLPRRGIKVEGSEQRLHRVAPRGEAGQQPGGAAVVLHVLLVQGRVELGPEREDPLVGHRVCRVVAVFEILQRRDRGGLDRGQRIEGLDRLLGAVDRPLRPPRHAHRHGVETVGHRAIALGDLRIRLVHVVLGGRMLKRRDAPGLHGITRLHGVDVVAAQRHIGPAKLHRLPREGHHLAHPAVPECRFDSRDERVEARDFGGQPGRHGGAGELGAELLQRLQLVPVIPDVGRRAVGRLHLGLGLRHLVQRGPEIERLGRLLRGREMARDRVDLGLEQVVLVLFPDRLERILDGLPLDVVGVGLRDEDEHVAGLGYRALQLGPGAARVGGQRVPGLFRGRRGIREPLLEQVPGIEVRDLTVQPVELGMGGVEIGADIREGRRIHHVRRDLVVLPDLLGRGHDVERRLHHPRGLEPVVLLADRDGVGHHLLGHRQRLRRRGRARAARLERRHLRIDVRLRGEVGLGLRRVVEPVGVIALELLRERGRRVERAFGLPLVHAGLRLVHLDDVVGARAPAVGVGDRVGLAQPDEETGLLGQVGLRLFVAAGGFVFGNLLRGPLRQRQCEPVEPRQPGRGRVHVPAVGLRHSGVQFIGRPFDEATLFRVAGGYEAISPSRGRRPQISEG